MKIPAKEYVEKMIGNYSDTYKLIDPTIKPLCSLLNEYEYYTFSSCQGHMKVVRKGHWKVDKDGNETLIKWKFVPFNRWFIVFSTEKSLKPLLYAAKEISSLLNSPCEIRESEYHNKKTNSTTTFIIDQTFPSHFTEKDFILSHKKIYDIMEKYLKNAES